MIDPAVALLLADRSPALRARTLVELLGVDPADDEVRDLAARIPSSPEAEHAVASAGDDVRMMSYALCRMGNLGLDVSDPRAARIADRLLAIQRSDGSWPLPSEGDDAMLPMQTSLPLRGLASVGLATDERAERAYEWLLAQRLDDGTWPTGMSRGQRRFVAGYRRLPRSDGCRSNTTGALACFAFHPQRRTSDAMREPLDILLGRETRDEWTIGFEVSRLLGVEPPRGAITFYMRFDLVLVLELAARAGASTDDDRVADLVAFLERLRGPHGLWEHPEHPQLSRWLTLHILVSLARIGAGDWAGTDLRIDFRAYPRRRRRS